MMDYTKEFNPTEIDKLIIAVGDGIIHSIAKGHLSFGDETINHGGNIIKVYGKPKDMIQAKHLIEDSYRCVVYHSVCEKILEKHDREHDLMDYIAWKYTEDNSIFGDDKIFDKKRK